MRRASDSSVEKTIKRVVNGGPRPVGSAALEITIAAVEESLELLGLRTCAHEFPCVRWQARSRPRLAIEGLGEVPCEAMIGSSEGSFSGCLESHGSYSIWGMYFWKAYRVRAEDGRLAAHVLARPDGPAIPQPVPMGSPSVPHLSIGGEWDEALDRCAATRCRAEGWLEASADEVSSRNLRAWKGEDRLLNGRIILVTAHCDTVPGSPGAYDNAGGVAALLGLAELLAEGELPKGVQLLFTSGEEQHLAGSRAFVKELDAAGRLSNVTFCLNLDGTGRGQILEAWVGPGALAERIHPALRTEEVRFVSPPPPSGDHYAFWKRGIPAVMLTYNDSEILHRPEDVLDPRKTRNAERMIELATNVISEMATGGS